MPFRSIALVAFATLAACSPTSRPLLGGEPVVLASSRSVDDVTRCLNSGFESAAPLQ